MSHGQDEGASEAWSETLAQEENPFKLPSDDKIFAMREEERQRRAEERERVKHLHVWEKVSLGFTMHGSPEIVLRTAACRHGRTRRIDDAEPI